MTMIIQIMKVVKITEGKRSNDKQVIYSSLLSACTELCRLLQNDKPEPNKTYISITEAININQ